MCVLSSSGVVDIPPVTSVDCIVGLTHQQSRLHLKMFSPISIRSATLSPFVEANIFLTEDPRIFIIGQRVYVTSSQWSGERSGVIKYLEETKFEKGAWAGVALDGFYHLPRLYDRVYDGSVDGTRYFQCPPKMCVFSRLSELTTMHPLKDGIQYQPAALQWTIEPIGPNSRVIEVGSRVMVTSSRGSAAGTLLRYISSPSDHALIWAGVKLDNPLGLDDGTMAGPLHIDCPPIFQVLASLDKISHEHLARPRPATVSDVVDLSSENESSPIAVMSKRTDLVSVGKLSCMGQPGCVLPVVYQLSCPQHYQSVQVVCSQLKCIGLILGKRQQCGCVDECLTPYYDTVTLDNSIL